MATNKIKPSIPKGTRDFNAETFYKRQFITRNIKDVYELFGFEPIQTPTMEKLDVLTGKYGNEGDQLIFKVLNSGDYLDKVPEKVLEKKESQQLTPKISEKGLRYDLTVPFARYVAQHRNDLVFPFKRYQMQSVYRADRPQKGRYREFLQCDADVIGTESLIAETEFLKIYDMVFRRLGIKQVTIQINNRKILAGIADYLGAPDKLTDMTVALDKLDKIGFEGVANELQDRGFNNEQIEKIHQIIELNKRGNALSELQQLLAHSTIGQEGIREVQDVLNNLEGSTVDQSNIQINLTLARGLSYYTGMIFEVTIPDSEVGSVSGGGRYDDLTSLFGFSDVSGVGISFGVDRIYDAMDTLDLWPDALKSYKTPTRVLVTYMDEEVKFNVMDFVEKLRYNGIPTEMYLDHQKLGKQFKYANDKGIPHVVIIGPEEIEKGEYQVKFMATGRQQSLAPAYIINALKPR